MANKEFKIQSDTISLNGVPLSSSVDGKVVIPGVTRATSFSADEVEDRDDDDFQYTQTIAVVDYIVYQELLNETGDGSSRADYITELDEDGGIDNIEVGGGGTYTAEESTLNANNDMYAYIGTGSASDRPIVPEDWRQIPYRPKMKANSVESDLDGGGGPGLGDFTIEGNTLQSSTVNVRGNSGVNIKTQNPSNPLATRDWSFTPTGRLVFPDGSQQTTAYTGGGGQPTINNTVKGFINLVGDRPNNNDDVAFESVVVRGQYAYVLGADWYINNSNNRAKVYKFDLETGTQVWVKQIAAGRGATFAITIGSGTITINSITQSGVGYKVGEEIPFDGYQVGGTAPQNNFIIIVDTIDEFGGVLTASVKPGYNAGAISYNSTVSSYYDDAQGDTVAISYDDFNDKLVVVQEYGSGRGDLNDSFWSWANVYVIDPVTGVINQTVTLSDEGDIYPNSIATHNSLGGVAIVGEKYNEYRERGPLTILAGGNGYFDILKSNLDPEHYPGAPFNNYSDFWITGTGITNQENVDQINEYANVATSVRQGSGAEFTIEKTGGFVVDATVTAGQDGINFVTTVTRGDQVGSYPGGTSYLQFGVTSSPGVEPPTPAALTAITTGSTIRAYDESNQLVTNTIATTIGPVFWVQGAGSFYIPVTWSNNQPYLGMMGGTKIEVGSSGGGGSASYSVLVTNGGTNYLAGHKIKVLGSVLGGADVTNDAIITVTSANAGVITGASITGTPTGSASTYTAVTGSNYNVGSGYTAYIYVDPATGAFSYGGSNNGGSNYVIGDVITVPGTTFAGGASPANDATIVVNTVDGSGNIQSIVGGTVSGTGPTTAIRIRVDGVDFTVEGTWAMRQNLGGEAFVWTPAWSNAIGGPSGDRFYDVCWTEDGTALYAVGRGRYEVNYDQALVVKFDASDGSVVWSKDIKFTEAVSESREARAVAVIPGSTDIMVAGAWYNGNLGYPELILTRMTDAGVAVWQKIYTLGSNFYETYYYLDYEINLKATNDGMIVSLENGTNNGNGLGWLQVDPTNGTVIRHRVLSADGNSNYNYYNTPTANWADIYTDADGDHVVMAGYTYVPTDNYYNALLFKLPITGVKDINPSEKLNLGEHILTRHDIFVTTVTPAFESFIPDEHVNTITSLVDQRNYVTRAPDGELHIWTYTVTNDSEGFLEFGDGSKQSFATNVIPQIPAANDYYLTEQDSGKHIFFEHENGRVYIPHWQEKTLPVGFTFTLVNTTGSNCFVETMSGNSLRGRLKLAGRNINTVVIGIPDSGSGSMVTLLKIKEGYMMPNSDGDQDYPDIWIVSGPGDVYDDY